MTKRDLVTRISNETGMIQLDVATIVQKFLDAYRNVLQMRERAEEMAQSYLGASYTPSPRPLTVSLNFLPHMYLKHIRSSVAEVFFRPKTRIEKSGSALRSCSSPPA